ncbi:MAG: hypothetical protein DPW11_02750 [bacterium]|nr:hypothetical protein [Candidatus Microgenomates bacterium CPR3]MCQ3944670.1 hypothetical protein [bacterium]
MISLSRQKDPRTKESIVNPKQRAKLRILAELDRQKHGKWPAFTTDEIDHEDWLLPVGEQNEINGWMYIAQAVRATDLLASRAYYEYQALNNQMLLNLQHGDYKRHKIETFEIEALITRYADFVRYVYFLLLLNHLVEDVYDEYEDLVSIELLEMTIQNSSISWIGITMPLREVHSQLSDQLMDGARTFYDMLAKKVKDSGIYLLSAKNTNLAWLKDKVTTIFES